MEFIRNGVLIPQNWLSDSYFFNISLPFIHSLKQIKLFFRVAQEVNDLTEGFTWTGEYSKPSKIAQGT